MYVLITYLKGQLQKSLTNTLAQFSIWEGEETQFGGSKTSCSREQSIQVFNTKVLGLHPSRGGATPIALVQHCKVLKLCYVMRLVASPLL